MEDWKKYEIGTYEKKFYDIKLHHGVVFLGCWPNAGRFDAGGYGQFDESLVAEVRDSAIGSNGLPLKEGIE